MDYEIGNINFSVKSEEQAQGELAAISRQKQYFADDEGIAGCPWEDDKPVVGWHTDSYPFVCVLMLSDCTNMVGGETALLTGDGNVLKVRGPQMVISRLSTFRIHADYRSGMCRSYAGSIYHSPGIASARRPGEDHQCHFLQAPFALR